MKKMILVLLLGVCLFAKQNYATKEDVNEIKSELKVIIAKLNSLDKKVERNTLRIEMLEKLMNKRFEDINRRFEDINRRFEDINRRFEDMNGRFDFIANILTALVAGIFGLVGFMMWDRRTMLEKAKRECDIKADKEYVEKIAQAIKEILSKDEFAREIFKKYGLL